MKIQTRWENGDPAAAHQHRRLRRPDAQSASNIASVAGELRFT